MSDWSRRHPQHLPNCQACLHANSRCIKSLSSCADFYPERWVRSGASEVSISGCVLDQNLNQIPQATHHLGLVCRSAGSGSRAAERSSLHVWKSVWWSRAWGLLLPQPVGKSGLPAGEGSWGTHATFHSCMNRSQYSSSTTTLVFFNIRQLIHKVLFIYLHMQISQDLVIYILNIIRGCMTFILLIQCVYSFKCTHIWTLNYDL